MQVNLKSFQVLKNTNRIIAIDILRAFAILSVVFFHFHGLLPYGHLGVDLFFVISGLLIGTILLKEYEKQNDIKYFTFILKRGFKIWPSYYFFLLIGNLIIFFIYNNTIDENQIIPISDLPRYLLFYRNYTGIPQHWSFDHIWSLCVEEHFYILLPLMFILLSMIKKNNSKTWMFIIIFSTIILGIFFKWISLNFTNGHDTYAATHNRIDALSWGVLLALILFHYDKFIQHQKRMRLLLFLSGITILISSISLHASTESILFQKVWFHSLIPLSFFLILLSIYHYQFKNVFILQFIAYYSYNWYLWHPIFAYYFVKHFSTNTLTLIIYLLLSFAVSILATVFIEEPFLAIRNKWFKKNI